LGDRGLLVTFEGIDGAGKTTQLKRLATKLRLEGHLVLTTREPGGTAIGDKVREILLSTEHSRMTPRTEALLYAASRAQHVDEVIRPKLAAGWIVLCDRFVDASIAYQGGGLELGEDAVADINDFALSGLSPDLTIMFRLSLKESRRRLMYSRGTGSLDRIEQRDATYFARVQEVFERLTRENPNRIYSVDASQNPDALEKEIHKIVWKQVSETKYVE
jgi:dTMP kinase